MIFNGQSEGRMSKVFAEAVFGPAAFSVQE